MRSQKIKIFVLIGIFGLLLFLQPAQRLWAGAGDNVSGWAWSENIGWVSFNNISGGGAVDYGLNIDRPTGIFSGYAWSENIGWISFNQSDLSGCPTSPCQAWIDPACYTDKCPVSGWARALAYGDGWDGWMRLNDAVYQIEIDSTSSPAQFEDWAWSDGVMGWASFNCENGGVCAGSDYKVLTSFIFNKPPQAAISCDPANCTVYTGEILTLNNDSTDPNGLEDISRSEWDILNWGASPDFSCSGICDYTVQSQLLGANNYTAQLYIEDGGGVSDTETQGFTILQDAIAGFMCSLDNEAWQVCEDMEEPEIGTSIYLKDDSLLAEHSSPSQGAASIVKRRWRVNGVVFDEDNNPNPSVRLNEVLNDIEIRIEDDAARTDLKTHPVSASLPLPEWIEIKPF